MIVSNYEMPGLSYRQHAANIETHDNSHNDSHGNNPIF